MGCAESIAGRSSGTWPAGDRSWLENWGANLTPIEIQRSAAARMWSVPRKQTPPVFSGQLMMS
jgi:hypothetical protein